MYPSIQREGSGERSSIQPPVVGASNPPSQPPEEFEGTCRSGTWLLVPDSAESENSNLSRLSSVRDPNFDWFAHGLSLGEMIDSFQEPSDFGPDAGAEPPSINLLFDPHAPVDGILDFDPNAPPLPWGPCTNNQGQTISCPPLPDLEPEGDQEPDGG